MRGAEFFVPIADILMPTPSWPGGEWNVQNGNLLGGAPWAITQQGGWINFTVQNPDQWFTHANGTGGDIGRAVAKSRSELGAVLNDAYSDGTAATDKWLYWVYYAGYAGPPTEHVCGQWHQGPTPGQFGASPPLAFHIDPTIGQGFYIDYRYDPADKLVLGGQNAVENIAYRDTSITFPFYTAILCQLRYGGATPGAGLINIWRMDPGDSSFTQIVNLPNINFGYSQKADPKGPAWKFGIYRSMYGSLEYRNPSTVSYFGMDAPPVGTSLAKYLTSPLLPVGRPLQPGVPLIVTQNLNNTWNVQGSGVSQNDDGTWHVNATGATQNNDNSWHLAS